MCVLHINYTDGNDGVTIRLRGKNKLIVNANGVKHIFSAKHVKQCVADLGAGDDIFAEKSNRSIAFDVKGGQGDDDLLGGFRRDKLDGGAGEDHITGGLGSDVLIGGAGKDVIVSLDASVQGGPGNNPGYTDEIQAADNTVDHILRDKQDKNLDIDDSDVFRKPEEVLSFFRPKTQLLKAARTPNWLSQIFADAHRKQPPTDGVPDDQVA